MNISMHTYIIHHMYRDTLYYRRHSYMYLSACQTYYSNFKAEITMSCYMYIRAGGSIFEFARREILTFLIIFMIMTSSPWQHCASSFTIER